MGQKSVQLLGVMKILTQTERFDSNTELGAAKIYLLRKHFTVVFLSLLCLCWKIVSVNLISKDTCSVPNVTTSMFCAMISVCLVQTIILGFDPKVWRFHNV